MKLNKKIIQIFWIIAASLVIISMIIFTVAPLL